MEFQKLVVPGGPLAQVWLAAHWPRRLKRQDYATADLVGALGVTLAECKKISLRCLGHIFLGTCCIFSMKAAQFEEMVKAVRENIWIGRSHDGPKVATIPKSQVTLSTPSREEMLWGADAFGQMDFGDCFDSGDFWSAEDVQQAVENGQQHVASFDDITRAPRIEPLMSMDAEDEAFGAATAEDLLNMQNLAEEASNDRQRTPEELPPIEQLLDGGHTPRPSGGPEAFGAQLLGRGFEDDPMGVTPEIGPRHLDFEGVEADHENIQMDIDGQDLGLDEAGADVPSPDASAQRPAIPAQAPGAHAAPFQLIPKERRKKKKPKLDQETEFSDEHYKRFSSERMRQKITVHPSPNYSQMLPHTCESLSFATPFSSFLDNPSGYLLFQNARQVADRRRQAQAEAANAALEARGAVASPGADQGEDNPAKRRRVDDGMGDAAVDQGIDQVPSPERSELGGRSPSVHGSVRGDFLQGSPGEFGDGPFGDMGDEGAAPPPISDEGLASSPGVAGQSQQAFQPVGRRRVVAASASATPEGKELKTQLANAWDRETNPVSFAEAVGPFASPEAVASSFVAMLALCDEGVLASAQDEAFAPIVLTQGPSWA